MPKSFTVSQLTEHCQAEAQNYKQTGQSNEIYCFELFRRALIEQDQMAWGAIYIQYQNLVKSWIFGYSRFSDTEEEVDFFVNAAFARLWQYGTKPEKAENFGTLGGCLTYLKLCVWSVIEDHLRRQTKDALIVAIPLESYDKPIKGTDELAEYKVMLGKLSRLLDEVIKNNLEQLVAEESWIYGQTPQKVHHRHPEKFSTPGEVSQIKRNIIKRLKRHPKLKEIGLG